MAAKKSTARTAATKKATPAKGAASTTANGTAKTAKKAATKSSSAAAKKPAKKTPATKSATTRRTAAKTASSTAPAKKATAKKATAKKATAKKAVRAPQGQRLVVREDESPWTQAELKEVRVELEDEIARLRADLVSSETELTAFLREPLDGAGDDQADAGAKSFEREHELSLLAGARAGLEQNLHALERLEDGTYGICESCGNPIGKLRLQAYPRATLCMTCKSTQERR